MPTLNIPANSFRDADDAQSPLIIDRFGPAWFFYGAEGEVVAVGAVPMPSDWDGSPVTVKLMGTCDQGAATVVVECGVTSEYIGSNIYGTPASVTIGSQSGTVFGVVGASVVTPQGTTGGDRFLAIRLTRTNAESSTCGFALHTLIVEYAAI